MSHISLSQAADKKFVEQTCRSFPLSFSFLLVPSFLPSLVFSSITIKIFLTHGGLYRDLTQRFLFRDFYGAGLGQDWWNGALSARENRFSRRTVSLLKFTAIYISLSLFLRIFPQLPSCSGRAVRPSSSSHEGSQKSPDNVEAIYQSSLPDKFYFFTVNLVRGHIASLMEKK